MMIGWKGKPLAKQAKLKYDQFSFFGFSANRLRLPHLVVVTWSSISTQVRIQSPGSLFRIRRCRENRPGENGWKLRRNYSATNVRSMNFVHSP